MNIDQAYLYIESGHSSYIWNTNLIGLINLIFLSLFEDFLCEIERTPKGTIPFLWRILFGNYVRVKQFKGCLAKKKNIIQTQKGFRIKAGVKSENDLRREFWVKLFLILLFIILILTNVPFFPLVNRIWTGDGADNLASNDDNWDTVSPSGGDDAEYDGTTGGSPNKNCTWDIGTINSVDIQSGYSGTITLDNNSGVFSTYTQSGGTFDCSSFNWQTDDIVHTGGTINVSTGTLIFDVSYDGSTGSGALNGNSGIITTSAGTNDWDWSNITFSAGTSEIQFSGTVTFTNSASSDMLFDITIASSTNVTFNGVQTLTTGTLDLGDSAVLDINTAVEFRLRNDGVSNFTCHANGATIQGIAGSELQFSVTSNRTLNASAVNCTFDIDIEFSEFESDAQRTISLGSNLSANQKVRIDERGGGSDPTDMILDTNGFDLDCQELEMTTNTILDVGSGDTVSFRDLTITGSPAVIRGDGTVQYDDSGGVTTGWDFSGGSISLEENVTFEVIPTVASTNVPMSGNNTGFSVPSGSNATLTITGAADKIIDLVDGKLRFDGGTGHLIQWVDVDSTVSGDALDFGSGVSDGICEYSRFRNEGNPGFGCTFRAGATPDWIIRYCTFDGLNDSMRMFSQCPDLIVEYCRLETATRSLGLNNGFSGRVKNCFLENALSSTTQIDPGKISNCTIFGQVQAVSNPIILHLSQCKFDETNITTSGGATIVSWQHNGTNDIEVFLGDDITVDSSVTSNLHSDNFNWDWVGEGDWTITGADNNRFEVLALSQRVLTHDDTPGGTFIDGEVITGSVTGATGIVFRATSTEIYYIPTSGEFAFDEDGPPPGSDVITGGDSGASVTITADPTNRAFMTSDFINVNPSDTIYLKYRGDVGFVQVQGYELDQATKTVATSTFTPNGEDFEATLVLDANTEFVQWRIISDNIQDQFYDIEIRDTDSSGTLLFNEDLINHYIWDAGVDYLDYQLKFDAGAPVGVPKFAESDNDNYDLIAQITKPDSNPVGWAFAVVDDDNFYFVTIDSGGVEVTKHVDTVNTLLYSATDANGDTGPVQTISDLLAAASDNNPVEFRVRWSDPNQNDQGSIEVWVDGFKIEFGDWVDESGGQVGGASGSEDYVVDTTFTEGSVGYVSDDAAIDDVVVNTHGFVVQNANLILSGGVDIIVAADGFVKFKNVSINANEGILENKLGGTYVADNVTWLSGSAFDHTIEGVATYKWTTITVNQDIVVQQNGQLILKGVFFNYTGPGDTFRILTHESNISPPIIAQDIRAPAIQPRVRTLHAVPRVYELDNSKEIVQISPSPARKLLVTIDDAYGRTTGFVTPTGKETREVSIRFLTIADNCLKNYLTERIEDEDRVEFMYALGILYGYLVREIRDLEVDPSNLDKVLFTAKFLEHN